MRRLVPLGIPLLLWGGVLGACSTKNEAIASGGECFFATDCAPGLVCVEQRNKTRICTDDLSGVAGEPPDPGGDQDGGDGEGGDPSEAGATDGPPVIQDTGTDTTTAPDTGIDTGIVDSGAG